MARTTTHKIELSPPWQIFYRELSAMFKYDSEIKLFFDETSSSIILYVDNYAKTTALGKLLPESVEFGTITLNIKVVPRTGNTHISRSLAYDDEIVRVFNTAFERNRVFRYAKKFDNVFSEPIIYVVFANETVQFYSDNLCDIHGVTTTLYQDIAKSIFSIHHKSYIYYCTDTPEPKSISTISVGDDNWFVKDNKDLNINLCANN